MYLNSFRIKYKRPLQVPDELQLRIGKFAKKRNLKTIYSHYQGRYQKIEQDWLSYNVKKQHVHLLREKDSKALLNEFYKKRAVPLVYGAKDAYAYTFFKMLPRYGVMTRIFQDMNLINNLIVDNKDKSNIDLEVLDFGSGPGTNLIALKDYFDLKHLKVDGNFESDKKDDDNLEEEEEEEFAGFSDYGVYESDLIAAANAELGYEDNLDEEEEDPVTFEEKEKLFEPEYKDVKIGFQEATVIEPSKAMFEASEALFLDKDFKKKETLDMDFGNEELGLNWYQSIIDLLRTPKLRNTRDLFEMITYKSNKLAGGKTKNLYKLFGIDNSRFNSNIEYDDNIPLPQYDVITCSYTLNELPSEEARTVAAKILFSLLKPSGYLIFVEDGNIFGESIIQSIRSTFINNELINQHIDIIAPCTSKFKCPLLKYREEEALKNRDMPLTGDPEFDEILRISKETSDNDQDDDKKRFRIGKSKSGIKRKQWCHFKQSAPRFLTPSTTHGQGAGAPTHNESFSYIAFKKKSDEALLIDDETNVINGARILSQPKRPKKQIVFEACNSEGELQKYTIGKRKYKHSYKYLKKLSQGSYLFEEVYKSMK